MKTERGCVRNWILFIKLLPFFVQVQSSVPREVLPKIERGLQDTIWYGENYHQLVKITNRGTMTCSPEQKSCECGIKYGYNTVVYNFNKKIVNCIKDEDVATDIAGHDGRYLKSSDGKCLGEKNQIISTTKCSKDDLSQRWLWTGIGNILNLKSLKCLKWHNSTREFTTEQCNSANHDQQWKPSMQINGGLTWKVTLMSDALNARPLVYNFTKSMKFYEGCYRVSGDELMAMVKKPSCKHAFHKNCHINLTINAPIFYNEDSDCNIVWKSSVYSVFGQEWKSFLPEDSKMFTLNPIDTERISLSLTMTSGDRFFEQWSGTLIRLSINCVNKERCVVLKIEGPWENKTQSVSSPTTSAFISTSIPANTESSSNGQQMSSMFFIVPVVALFCLLIVAFVIVVYYRRRGKRLNSEKDRHLYEECSANPLTTYEDPALLTEMQELVPYDSPGITIYETNHYERPGYEVAENPDKPVSRQKDKNGKEFQYDYATREETSVLPLILNDDNEEKTAGFAKTSRKKIISDTNHCSGTVDTTGTLEPSEKRDRRMEKTPIYHTLEEDSPDTDANISAYAEPHENLDLPTSNKRIYHTLEGDSPEVDDNTSAYAEPHENL